MCNCLESNIILKLKFRNLHTTVVDSVDPASIADFLFQGGVLSEDDVSDLLGHTDEKQKTRNLLNALYKTENPQAFVKLYAAIKEQSDSDLKWLIDRIDSESTGDCVLKNDNVYCSSKQELSYRKQIARQLRTQYVGGISETLKSRLRVTQGHRKRNHWADHKRLTIS